MPPNVVLLFSSYFFKCGFILLKILSGNFFVLHSIGYFYVGDILTPLALVILVYIIINLVTFLFIPERFLKWIKSLLYLFIPIYIIFPLLKEFLLFIHKAADVNHSVSTAIDITYLTYTENITLLLAGIILQFLFNNYFHVLIDKVKNLK